MRFAVVGHTEWVEFAVVERVPQQGTIAFAAETFDEPGGGGAVAAMQLHRLAGAEAAFFTTVLAAWLLFPLLVGLRNTLDAGGAFMLIALGVVVVVGVAQNGLDILFP